MRLVSFLLLVAVGMVSVACGDDQETLATVPLSTHVPGGLDGTLTVFAAASLTDAFGEIQTRLEDANPELAIDYNFGGSQQLATQLSQGANADVFASANEAQMTTARDEGQIDGESVIFARNRLAIIVPTDNPAGIDAPGDLATDDIKLVVANPDVPVGGYTLDVLDSMSGDPTVGSDFRSRVEANIVSEEENVRQVVTKVRLGEADAGIVYASDVTEDARNDITLIEIPDALNIIAEYPIAPVAGGNGELAQAFIDFLLSADGQAILEAHGFAGVEP